MAFRTSARPPRSVSADRAARAHAARPCTPRLAVAVFLVQTGLSLASALGLAAGHDLQRDNGVLASLDIR